MTDGELTPHISIISYSWRTGTLSISAIKEELEAVQYRWISPYIPVPCPSACFDEVVVLILLTAFFLLAD